MGLTFGIGACCHSFSRPMHVCAHLPSSSGVLSGGVVIVCVHSEWAGTWFTVYDGISVVQTGVSPFTIVPVCLIYGVGFLP